MQHNRDAMLIFTSHRAGFVVEIKMQIKTRIFNYVYEHFSQLIER